MYTTVQSTDHQFRYHKIWYIADITFLIVDSSATDLSVCFIEEKNCPPEVRSSIYSKIIP